MGGTILYNNRVVATQLTAELTRKLIFSDPYHIRVSKVSFKISSLKLIANYFLELCGDSSSTV